MPIIAIVQLYHIVYAVGEEAGVVGNLIVCLFEWNLTPLQDF